MIKKPHNVCFECRVAMKGALVCPHCKKSMPDMGRDFKAPPRRDKSAWKAVEAMVARGSYGTGLKGRRGSRRSFPRTANAVERIMGSIDDVYCRRYIKPEAQRILKPHR